MRTKLELSTVLAASLIMVSWPAPGHAAQPSCNAWQVAKVEREEGKRWTASVCAKRKGRDAFLEIVCYGAKWNIRYQPVLPDSHNPGDGMSDFVFKTSAGARRVALGFEGLDGAFATDFDRRHPLFEMMMRGDRLSIRDTTAKVAMQSYTLSGSRKALSKLMRNCR